jgi:hypothetical protein
MFEFIGSLICLIFIYSLLVPRDYISKGEERHSRKSQRRTPTPRSELKKLRAKAKRLESVRRPGSQ